MVDRNGLARRPLEVVDMIESAGQTGRWSATIKFCVEECKDNDWSIPLKLTDKFLVVGPRATKRSGDVVNESPNGEKITDRESERHSYYMPLQRQART